MSKRVIYISGPMTGVKDWNYPAFYEAEARLEDEWLVLNPGKTPLGLKMESYMDIDLALVRASDALYMLKGWKKSPGARVEFAYAEWLGLEVIYE